MILLLNTFIKIWIFEGKKWINPNFCVFFFFILFYFIYLFFWVVALSFFTKGKSHKSLIHPPIPKIQKSMSQIQNQTPKQKMKDQNIDLDELS